MTPRGIVLSVEYPREIDTVLKVGRPHSELVNMHPGRILGIVMGLVILAAVFVLPINMAGYSLYYVVAPLMSAIGSLQTLPYQQMVFGYGLVVSFILLVIAGVVGFFPLGTGVLGVVGAALLAAVPYMISLPVTWGVGFYVIWIASIVSLGASFWHRREKAEAKAPAVQVNVQQAPPQTPPPAVQAPPPPPQVSDHRSVVIVNPTIEVKTETRTGIVPPLQPAIETKTPSQPSLESKAEPKLGVSYTPEEAMKMFQMLKQRAGTQTPERLQEMMNQLRFKDASGRMWRIDPETSKWAFNDGKTWVEANPPPILESV